MGKTRAEIQKAYRERLKAKNNEQYLAKERKRRRESYIPSSQLSRRDRLRRNIKNNETLKRHRERKKLIQAEQNNRSSDMETSGYDSQQSQGPLLIRMAFPNKKKGPRKRMQRALAMKTRQLKKKEDELSNLQRKYKTLLKRLERKRKSVPSTSTPCKSSKPMSLPHTPKRQTAFQMKEMRLTGKQKSKVYKQLLLSNAVINEVASAKSKVKRSQRTAVHSIIAGKIVKRYRCISLLSQKTGLSRNKLGKVKTKSVEVSQQKRNRKVQKFQDIVVDFMSRDDNSRNLPGKSDKMKTAKHDYTQKRILTDYLSNLHAKFTAEHPEVKLSLASFCRIRPKYILTTSFITRDCCLCTRHQNMALILKSLKPMYPDIPLNPEKYSEDHQIDRINDSLSDEEITFSQWKRVSVEQKGKSKMIMKIVQVTESKTAFIETLARQTQEFVDHVSRLRTQYSQIRQLKDNLPKHHMIVHMDFAENYNCKSLQEIQSAYWNQTSVTLHPTVIYNRPDEGSDLQHQSFVFVSDDMNHNSITVLTFLHKIIQEIKKIDPEVQHVHYWTDSPTSQYRNKTIFNTIANHNHLFGMKATWNYFEAGHGKGPCDGLGGTVKRMADEAVKTGKVTIQDPNEFYDWSQSSYCSMSNVQFRFVSKNECEAIAVSESKTNPKPIKGTMKIHAVVGSDDGHVFVRDTSCYCDMCLTGELCNTWRKETLSSDEHTNQTNTSKNTTASCNHKMPMHNADEFVAAKYSGQWYIGKIKTVDTDEREYEIQFMERKKCSFQWPDHEDII